MQFFQGMGFNLFCCFFMNKKLNSVSKLNKKTHVAGIVCIK